MLCGCFTVGWITRKRNKQRQTKGIIMRTGVRLFSLFLSSGAIKRGSQKGERESSKSSIAFVTENDGDPSGKTIEGGGVISPVIISYGGPYTKGETGACKGHIGYKRRQNKKKKKEKKLTNVLVKDLQPASEWNSIDPTSRLMNLNFGNCVINDPSGPNFFCCQQRKNIRQGFFYKIFVLYKVISICKREYNKQTPLDIYTHRVRLYHIIFWIRNVEMIRRELPFWFISWVRGFGQLGGGGVQTLLTALQIFLEQLDATVEASDFSFSLDYEAKKKDKISSVAERLHRKKSVRVSL